MAVLIDDALGNALGGLVVNVLTAIGVRVAGMVGGHPDPPFPAIPPEPPLSKILRGMAVDDDVIDRALEFAGTEFATTITRSLLVAKIAGRADGVESAITEQLRACLVLVAQMTENDAGLIADAFYLTVSEESDKYILRAGRDATKWEKVRKAAIDEVVAGHLDDLGAISRTYRETTAADVAQYRRFRDDYRQRVRERHKYTTSPNVVAGGRAPIEEIYVPNRLHHVSSPSAVIRLVESEVAPPPTSDEEYTSAYAYADARPYEDDSPEDESEDEDEDAFPFGGPQGIAVSRIVFLGHPGSGKSTLSSMIVRRLTEPESPVLPILVNVRELAQARRTQSLSIVEFIELQARSRYLTPSPRGAVSFLLSAGLAMVIFDGLDEIVAVSDRQEAADDIALFAIIHKSAPVLATSRIVGYDQAQLDPTVFEVYALEPFTDHQVALYAHKWFALASRSAAEGRTLALAFTADTDGVKALRSNPLMLALLCSLYRATGYLPRRRVDVYQTCAQVLLTQWDERKGIKVSARAVSALLKYLAHEMYFDRDAQTGLRRSELHRLIGGFLRDDRWTAGEEAADDVADEIIEYVTGRAWILANVGSAGEEPTYWFTFRPILEYFAAGHLVRRAVMPAALWDELRDSVEQGTSASLVSLAVQLMDMQNEGSGREIVDLALADIRAGGNVLKPGFVRFAIDAMDYVDVPANNVLEISRLAILTDIGLSLYAGDRRARTCTTVASVLGKCPPDLRADVVDELVRWVNHQIAQDPVSAWAAVSAHVLILGIALARSTENHLSGTDEPASSDEDIWARMPELDLVAEYDVELALYLCLRRRYSLDRLTELHGTDWIFAPRHMTIIDPPRTQDVSIVPLVGDLVRDLTGQGSSYFLVPGGFDAEKVSAQVAAAAREGKIVAAHVVRPEHGSMLLQYYRPQFAASMWDRPYDVRIGTLVLLCCLQELAEVYGVDAPMTRPLRGVLKAFVGIDGDGFKDVPALGKQGPQAADRKMFANWLAGTRRFVIT